MLDLRATLDKLLELQVHGGSGVSVGTITEYAGAFPPDGWVICDGRTLSRTVYAELFNEIGTTWGAGDGSTTFNIPDLRNKFSVGTGDLYSLTNSGGNKDSMVPYHNHSYVYAEANTGGTAITTAQMPKHTHSGLYWLNPDNLAWNVTLDGGNAAYKLAFSGAGGTTSGGAGAYNEIGFRVGQTGSGQTHNHSISTRSGNTGYVGTNNNLTNANLPPYLAMNFIIFTGVFQTLAAQTTWTLLEDRIQNSQLTIPIPSIFDEPITIDDDIKIKINQNVTTGVDYELNNTINILGWSDLVTNSEISFKGILSRMSHGAAVVGTIMEYAGIFPPDGWIVCDGRALSRTMYEELFDAIGTSFGSGDGSTTFNIPDLRGRVAIGSGGDYGLGNNGGEKTHTLTVAELPAISGSLPHIAYGEGKVGGVFSVVDSGSSNDQGTNMSSPTTRHYELHFGNNQPHNNMQPYLAVNYIIFTGVLQTVAAATTWTLLQDRISNSQLHIPVITNFQDKIYYNGKEYWETIYPVGSYYETSDPDFDPNVEWGGFWKKNILKNDLIVDQGQSGTLIWIKYQSGRSECFGLIHGTSGSYQAYNHPYNYTVSVSWPSGLFNSRPTVSFGCHDDGGGFNLTGTMTTNSATTSQLYVESSSVNASRYYNVHAKGTWKTYTPPTTLYRWQRKHPLHINLSYHGSWVDSGITVNEYTVYKSESSYNVNSAWDTVKITFSGRTSLSVGIRSYAESTYDYVLVSELDNDYLASQTSSSSIGNAYSNTTYTKAHTRGNQSASAYTIVTFDNINPNQEHYFYIIYRKDGSTHTSDDRGYFYIID